MMQSYAFFGNQHVLGCVEARLAEAGFVRTDASEAAAWVITYCTSMTELEDLYFGDDGLLGKLAADALVVDLSPVTPNFAAEMNAITTVSGHAMVTAPLVVHDKVATDALAHENLSCFCFGEDGAAKRAQPLLDALFSSAEEAGSAGAAQLSRMAITIQDSAEIVSAVECLALFKSAKASMSIADAGGAEPEACAPEVEFMLEAVSQKRFNGAYTIEMMMAELSSVMMAADDYELILPQVESAFHLLELLAVIGGASKSPAALSLVFGSDHDGDAYGLDWSRADALYAEAADGPDADQGCAGYDDEDDYLDGMFGASSGFSAN